MNEVKKFIKSTGVYLFGNMLTKIVAFFMLPLYTKYLEPTEFGAYDLYIAYITFLSSVLFLDIWGGIMRFMFDYRSDEERAKPVVVGTVIFSISTLVYGIAVIILGNLLDIPYIGWLFLYGLTTNIVQLVGYVSRAKGENTVYVLGGLLGTIINISLNIIFIAVLHGGYKFLYISYCIGNIFNIYIVGRGIHFTKMLHIKHFNKELFKQMLRFAAPLPINSAAYWFLSSYNKVVISNQLSTTENGFYAVANKFSTTVTLVTQCFQMAWQELTFSKAGSSKEDMDKFYTIAVNEYIKFLFLGTIMIIPCIKIIFPFMIDNSYAVAENIVPFSLFATFFSCLSSFIASIINTIKKNSLIFTTTTVGSLINVLLINLLIDPLGVQAASIALSCGFLMIFVMRLVLIRRFVAIQLNLKVISLLTCVGVIVCFTYFFQGLILNGITFIALMCFGVYMYRDKILILINKISDMKG